MRPVLWGLPICIACMPLVLVLYLVAAVKHPRNGRLHHEAARDHPNDRGRGDLARAGYGKGLDRILRLDLENPEACGLTDSSVKCSDDPATSASKK